MKFHSHTCFNNGCSFHPPVFPPAPSLNSSFPEALSRSLLQITEIQSRTIEAMKASQEAQATVLQGNDEDQQNER